MSQESQKSMEQYFFRASSADFKKIPGSPIAYWANDAVLNAFASGEYLGDKVVFRKGMVTADNGSFIRGWHEVSLNRIGFNCVNRDLAKGTGMKWFPYTKGGEFRKWYGNNNFVVDWENDGVTLQTKRHHTDDRVAATNFNLDYIFKAGATYSSVSSSDFSIRYTPQGFLYDQKGAPLFSDSEENLRYSVSLLNSKASKSLLGILCPTLDFNSGSLANVPALSQGLCQKQIDSSFEMLVKTAKADWDGYEVSWGFLSFPLLRSELLTLLASTSYRKLRSYWQETTLEMQRLEEENNRIFIDAYGLQDELTSEVPLKEVTLSCNPYYRYGDDKTEGELEAQLQSDTMAEFLSYAVGCMFGRYSLDKPGLVLAHQGDTLAEYLRQIPEPRFMPDEDNVIPLLDGEWFADDVTERFRTFIRVTFGEEHYEENLAFIEASLGKDVRKYFTKDFYTDHVKRYKKRPIYWLFTSSKGTFSALIYLHRYRPDTVSVVLQYLRDFRKKLAARLDYLQQVGISTSTSQGEKTRALKEIETLKKQLLELDDYERDTLYPLATEQVALDLDDGVKVNYLKLGSALKKIIGLDAKED